MKKERATMSDEARERMLIAEQIERAKAEVAEDERSDSKSGSPPADEGLKRDEGEKVVLSLSAKPSAGLASASASGSSPSATPTTMKLNPLKPTINPLKANPLKRPNVFKTAATGTSSSGGNDKTNDKKRPASSISAAEKLILEDQERKRRRMERESAS
jgi:DNA/RNA-binding protein KIN17